MQPYQEQPWKESLFGCLNDLNVCCYGCWCWCCLYGKNVEKIDRQSKCLINCCLYSLMSFVGCCCFLHVFKRVQLRERYGLEENICSDCFITCCCAPCAICQEARELKTRGHQTLPIIVIRQPTLSLSSAIDFEMNHQ